MTLFPDLTLFLYTDLVPRLMGMAWAWWNGYGL